MPRPHLGILADLAHVEHDVTVKCVTVKDKWVDKIRSVPGVIVLGVAPGRFSSTSLVAYTLVQEDRDDMFVLSPEADLIEAEPDRCTACNEVIGYAHLDGCEKKTDDAISVVPEDCWKDQ
jgi:hypothetical protein